MKELDLNARAREIGQLLFGRLGDLAAAFPAIGQVRGRGAMVAIEIVEPGTTTPDPALAARLSAGCHQAGVLTLTCGTYGNVLRFLPPLVAPDRLLHEAMDVLAEVASI
jgi:4-aminobutyrate aminotransferase/(S)-3-amino-2-methylpropionate transaminase